MSLRISGWGGRASHQSSGGGTFSGHSGWLSSCPVPKIVQGVSIETAVLLLGGKPAVCPLLGAECWRELPGIESTRGSPRLGGGAAECSSEWAASCLCGSRRPPGDAAEGRACSLALWFGRAAGPRSCVQPYGWPLEGAAAPRLLRQAPPGAWSLGSMQICFCFFSTSVLRFSPSDLERKTEMKGSLRGDCGLSFPSCAQCKPTLMRPFEKGG